MTSLDNHHSATKNDFIQQQKHIPNNTNTVPRTNFNNTTTSTSCAVATHQTPTTKTGKRKMDAGRKDEENHGTHHHSNKKEIQDGFSWWTSMMVGLDPKATHVIVKKVSQNKVE